MVLRTFLGFLDSNVDAIRKKAELNLASTATRRILDEDQMA